MACSAEVLHFFDFRERLLSVARFLTAPWLFHWPSSVTSDTFLSCSCAFMFLFIRESWFHDTSNDWGNPDVYQNHLTMSSLWRRACDYKTFRKYKLLFITITRDSKFHPSLIQKSSPRGPGADNSILTGHLGPSLPGGPPSQSFPPPLHAPVRFRSERVPFCRPELEPKGAVSLP